jgi:hypothetical protein
VIASTVPNSPGSNFSNPPLPSRTPNSDITDVRPKVQHPYFNEMIKTTDVTPPTPPDSGKVETVVPNGHVNGHRRNPRGSDRSKSISPPSPLTPPPVTSPGRLDIHLNDDYSNLYYSDDDLENCEEDFAVIDEDDSEDDGDRLEMRFGSKKKE